jgi:hypothetical protein
LANLLKIIFITYECYGQLQTPNSHIVVGKVSEVFRLDNSSRRYQQ